ncbi:MAG: hypothetical protein KDA44_08255 [Planctomycetales bacterium]|nr:hypothetical protein [Planctomycetales bacterium]
MFRSCFLLASVLVLLSMVVPVAPSRGGTVFLGPTPYLNAADSPFPVDGSNPRFFLEDFEDGLLNTPGVTTLTTGTAKISAPGPTTDSVDGDDGLVDGSGTSGWSLQRLMFPDFTNVYFTSFNFRFSESELGLLPNAFGIV